MRGKGGLDPEWLLRGAAIIEPQKTLDCQSKFEKKEESWRSSILGQVEEETVVEKEREIICKVRKK